MVQMASTVSEHKFNLIRERLADKAEVIKFDPYGELNVNINCNIINQINFSVLMKVLYREKKKIRSM